MIKDTDYGIGETAIAKKNSGAPKFRSDFARYAAKNTVQSLEI